MKRRQQTKVEEDAAMGPAFNSLPRNGNTRNTPESINEEQRLNEWMSQRSRRMREGYEACLITQCKRTTAGG